MIASVTTGGSLARRAVEARVPHYEITSRLLEEAGVEWGTIEAAGEDRLGELLWATLLGDYASYYLAALNGVDPTPVEPIAQLKSRLADHPAT